MIFHDHPQGSEAWLEDRRGVITASRFKDARERNKPAKGEAVGKPSAKMLGYAFDTARERVGGKAPQKFQNGAMRTGTEQEPLARLAYESRTGELVEETGFYTTDDHLFGVSVDGLVGEDGVIEIKTMVSSDTLFAAVVNGDTSGYLDQCNGAMWLLGRKWVDLILWAPDLEPIGKHLTIKRIERDDDAINELEIDLLQFAALVSDLESQLRKEAA
jgi:predicted phage-related endonuclease